MPRSFDIVAESEASVAQIHAAFGREDYWLARLAGDGNTTLNSLTVDADGTVEVHLTQHLGRQILPALAANFVPGDLKLAYHETWQAVGDGHVRGESRLSASGGLGSSRAQNWLTPTGTATRLRSAVEVKVKIPLVGGSLEKTIGAGLADSIPAVLRFTTTWIAENT